MVIRTGQNFPGAQISRNPVHASALAASTSDTVILQEYIISFERMASAASEPSTSAEFTWRGIGFPPFAYAIGNILFLGSDKKVVRINTRRHIAMVADIPIRRHEGPNQLQRHVSGHAKCASFA
jgi:hypothetical protein